jgi:hypothetical protein
MFSFFLARFWGGFTLLAGTACNVRNPPLPHATRSRLWQRYPTWSPSPKRSCSFAIRRVLKTTQWKTIVPLSTTTGFAFARRSLTCGFLKWPNCEAHSRVQGRATGVDVVSPGNGIDISYVYSK